MADGLTDLAVNGAGLVLRNTPADAPVAEVVAINES
jgi:hypothetical protein